MPKNGTMPQMFLQTRLNDKRIVTNALSHFDGFQIPASVPASGVSYIRDIGKPFFIDPMAYMFTLPPAAVIDPKNNKVRPTLSALAKRYSDVIGRTVGKRMLLPNDILDQIQILEEITHNALDYQRTKLEAGDLNLINPHFDKYAALALEGDDVPHSTTALSPWVLIPPFFYSTDTDDPWYTATLRCARFAVEFKNVGEKLFPAIFLSPDMLDHSEAVDRIVADFTHSGFDGTFVWANNMDEESASPLRLANLVRLIDGLSARKRPVFKIYGGFFSILLHGKGLEGFSCSLNYRSSRDVMRYRWAAPKPAKPKFYVPKLHKAYGLEESEHILKMFPSLRCQCEVCVPAYGADLDSFKEKMKEPGYCQNHFLNARRSEVRSAKDGSERMVEEIDETIRQLGRKNAVGVKHLTKWRDVLSTSVPFGLGSHSQWTIQESPRSHPLGV